jgi:serine/threonine protein kinase
MKNKIGAGKFSSVHLARSRFSGREYAVKMMEKDRLKADEKELLK